MRLRGLILGTLALLWALLAPLGAPAAPRDLALPHAVAAAVAPTPAFSSSPLFAFAGDSRTLQGFDNGTGRFFLESRGAPAWAMPASGSRFLITSPNQYGVGGDTTALLLARWGTVLSDPAPNIALMIGVNDRRSANLSLAQSIANVTAMLDAAYAAGKTVYLSDEMPFTDPSYTGSRITDHVAFHNWLAQQPSLRLRVKAWPTWDSIIDPATIGTTYAPLAGTMLDESSIFIHPLTAGAKLIGQNLGTVIAATLPPFDYSRPYVPGETASRPILNANPAMAGTAGAKGSGVTGSIADSWTGVLNGAGAGISVVGSKETIGSVEFQVLTFSGTGSAGAPQFTLRPTTDLTLTAGASYDMRARIILSAGATNMLSVQPEARVDSAPIISRPLDGYQAPDTVPTGGFDLTLVSPLAIVPAAGVTTVRGEIIVIFSPSVAVSGVVKIALAGARESP